MRRHLCGIPLLLATTVLTINSAHAAASTTSNPVAHKHASKNQAGSENLNKSKPTGQNTAASASNVPKKNLALHAPVAANEDVIVTGTHAYNRRARDSTAPITVVNAATLRRSGEVNIAQALTRLDPSLNMQAVGITAGALTASLRMRGLNPNEVLVLVDGKRRHTTGNIYADQGPSQGSTPVDLNMIPSNAIDHIEILRDGAAAMYGSDAIAGVINIILKKNPSGLNMSAQTGANAYTGNGWQYQTNIDGGWSFLGDGYVHMSGQVYHTDHMVASASDLRLTPGNSEYLGLNVPQHSNVQTSTPEETRENLGIEFGKPFSENVEGYGLITYGHRHSESNQIYRLPTIAPSAYPYGFTPLLTIEENDYAATLGVKGHHLLGFDFDLSTTYGADEDDIGVKNSFNTNLYSITGSSPTTVRAESYRMAQWTNNLDLRRNINILHRVPMTLAFGAEHRLETYNIMAGEAASYLYGGTQAYGGIRPESAGAWSRDIWAGYLDGDFHPLKHWDLDFAGRFEHYTDAGNTENGKISSRYDFTKRIALRATISNGFRAPTLSEEHYSSLISSPTGATGLLATTSPGGRLLGASQLKPERSTNVEGGIILQPIDGWHVSADVYQINIRDRIFGGGSTYGDLARQAIELSGISIPSGINSSNIVANYFANVGNTRTQGVDIASDYILKLKQYGTVDLSLSLNINRTRMSHIATNANGQPLLNGQTVSYLTTGSPQSKIILNAYWSIGDWGINVRQTRYGETVSMLTYQDATPASLTCNGAPLRYSNVCWGRFVNTPAWLTDIEVSYRMGKHWTFAIGANNVFNIRPRRLPKDLSIYGGKLYDFTSSSLGIQGGYYYGRINAAF